MATSGDGKLQTDGGDSPMDTNDTSRRSAMPFTLIKLAYFACVPECRESYDTRNFGVSVDLKACCKFLMAPGNSLRALKSEDDEGLDVCSTAAFNGHIDCLRQAHVAGIPWDWRTIEVSCRTGHLECLMYAHDNGCEAGGYTPALAAACAGQLQTLDYTWNRGFKFPVNLCTLIARFGSIESLRYLRSLGFGWDVTTTAAAARYNQLEFLKYLRQRGCPWDATTCHSAASNGNIECLKYAHTNGCEWDMRTCHAAAQNGHLNCLEYAHTNGCTWNVLTTMTAAINKQHRCFRYAVEKGCPWPSWLSWDHLH